MTRSKLTYLLALLTCLALVAAGCAGEDDAASDDDAGAADEDSDDSDSGDDEELATVTVGRATTASSVAVVLGMEQGFFEEEGLNIEVENSPTGAGAVAQLQNEEITVALGGLSGPIAAVAQGIGVVFVSGGVADHEVDGEGQYQTLVSPDSGIETFSDLEGATVAINSVECCWEFWTKEAVEKDGGDPSAVDVTQIPFPDQLTAMREGRVDAVTTLQPFATQLREEGFESLGNTAAIAHEDPENGNTNYFMARSFVEENPETVAAWQTALGRAADYANNNPEETKAAIVEITGQDPDLIDRAPMPFYVSEIDEDTVQREADFLVKYGVLDEAPPLDELIWEDAELR